MTIVCYNFILKRWPFEDAVVRICWVRNEGNLVCCLGTPLSSPQVDLSHQTNQQLVHIVIYPWERNFLTSVKVENGLVLTGRGFDIFYPVVRRNLLPNSSLHLQAQHWQGETDKYHVWGKSQMMKRTWRLLTRSVLFATRIVGQVWRGEVILCKMIEREVLANCYHINGSCAQLSITVEEGWGLLLHTRSIKYLVSPIKSHWN